MLVLSRKVGERIKIGDNIIIEVREFYQNKVRIGIIAPKNIPVYRTELLDRDEEYRDYQEGGRDNAS